MRKWCVLLFAVVAAADERVADLEAALERCQWSRIEFPPDLARDPVAARRICAAALNTALWPEQRERPRKGPFGFTEIPELGRLGVSFRQISEELVEFGTSARDHNPKSADARLACLDARLLAMRVGLHFRRSYGVEAWLALAAEFEGLGSEAGACHAIKALWLARHDLNVPPPALAKAEAELRARGLERFPAAPLLEASRLAAEIDALGDDRKEKRRLKPLVAQLGELVNKTADADIAECHEHAVTRARLMRVKAAYVVTTHEDVVAGLDVSVPQGRRWRLSPAKEDDRRLLTQYDVLGHPVRRIELEYVGRDVNTGELAREALGTTEARFKETDERPRVRRQRLNATFGTVSIVDISGKEAKRGLPMRMRVLILEAAGRDAPAYRITVVAGNRAPQPDPALDAVLESLSR